jgi:hypothetical protein
VLISHYEVTYKTIFLDNKNKKQCLFFTLIWQLPRISIFLHTSLWPSRSSKLSDISQPTSYKPDLKCKIDSWEIGNLGFVGYADKKVWKIIHDASKWKHEWTKKIWFQHTYINVVLDFASVMQYAERTLACHWRLVVWIGAALRVEFRQQRFVRRTRETRQQYEHLELRSSCNHSKRDSFQDQI